MDPAEVFCSCGSYHQNDPQVLRRNAYSFWGWTAVFLGITVRPVRVDFICPCGRLITSSAQPEDLDRYLR